MSRLRQVLKRADVHTVINIGGLAIGLCAGLLIALIIRTETHYDRFFPDYERVYRVSTIGHPPGKSPTPITTVVGRVAGWLEADFSESLEAVGRFTTAQHSLKHGDVEASERIDWADPELTRILRFPTLAGDITTALDAPDGIVLDREMALKYFGRTDVVGESIEIDRRFTMRVTAVMEKLPDSSHVDTRILASALSSHSETRPLDEAVPPSAAMSFHTYVKLRRGVDPENVRRGLRDTVLRHSRAPVPGAPPSRDELILMPVADIHLDSRMPGPLKPTASVSLLVALGSIGALIVLIAGINYVNLMTARGAQRAVEVGVRKSFGARRRELILQFMAESIGAVAIAAVMAMLLAALLRPHLSALLQAEIPATFWRDPQVWLAFVGATLAIGVLAAAYPAFILSSFRPGVVLRGGPVSASGSGIVRNVLIGCQLAVFIGLLIAAVFIHRQGQFAVNEALKLDTDQVLVIQTGFGKPCNAALRDEIRKLPGVRAAACSLLAPFSNTVGVFYKTRNSELMQLTQSHIDFDFFEVYNIRPIAGRVFSAERGAADAAPADPGAAGHEAPLVINETAVRQLGFASNAAAVGQTLPGIVRLMTLQGRFGPPLPAQIIGVVPDFPMASIRDAVLPAVYFVDPHLGLRIHVKIASKADIPQTLDAIDRLWKEFGDARPIQRRFASENIEERYQSLTRQARVFSVFSWVALLLACLGLFGLSAFATERRTREVGIRKALGAGRPQIVRHFLWLFTKPVLWSALVALPVSGFLVRRWLDGFAYRVDLDGYTFLGAVLVTWLVACVTVLTHVMRAARARPVEALRYE
jgi:putative ABC transport system permease protein